MKRRKVRNVGFSIAGAFIFFVLIAFVMQIAILVYDYIRQRTDNAALIAVLILIVIIALSAFCTIFDWVRRKIMVDKPTKKILKAVRFVKWVKNIF